MPEHIGVVLDGNRRWASEHSISPWIGHKVGAEKVEDLLNWCLDLKVKAITLYVFSKILLFSTTSSADILFCMPAAMFDTKQMVA